MPLAGNKFINPFDALIKNKNKIYILADGPLYRFPMELLIDDNGDYLINYYDISYLSSLEAFFKRKKKLKHKDICFVFLKLKTS